jgi:hypothetical protein
VNAKDAAGGDGATQFGRALTELNIETLCANSPQAKSLPLRKHAKAGGHVGRAFGELQDRLVKSLPSRKRGNCVACTVGNSTPDIVDTEPICPVF